MGRLVRETKMEIVWVNYEKVGMAIRMMTKRADIYKRGLQGLCPERTGRRGARQKLSDIRNARRKFGKVRKPVGRNEKMELPEIFLELAVIGVFRAHV